MENLKKVIDECTKEIYEAKKIQKTFTHIRNGAIRQAYQDGISAKDIAKLCQVSVQMIHRIVK
mgnify:CR=1 FL=1